MESGDFILSTSYVPLVVLLLSLNSNFSICKMGLVIVAKYDNYVCEEQM